MTKQEWQKFDDMVREFESAPNTHLYEITFYYGDGTTDTMNVRVDAIAIQWLTYYVAYCGMHAKAKLLQ